MKKLCIEKQNRMTRFYIKNLFNMSVNIWEKYNIPPGIIDLP
jgi:hypothetical protein